MDDTGDTMVVLLARMEALEAENSLLHETVDILQQTVDVLGNTVIVLQNTDNTTNDHLPTPVVSRAVKFKYFI